MTEYDKAQSQRLTKIASNEWQGVNGSQPKRVSCDPKIVFKLDWKNKLRPTHTQGILEFVKEEKSGKEVLLQVAWSHSSLSHFKGQDHFGL